MKKQKKTPSNKSGVDKDGDSDMGAVIGEISALRLPVGLILQ